MRLCFDSNRYSDFCRGDERTAQVFRTTRDISVPLIVLAELRAGFAHGARRAENERLLTRFLSSDRVSVLCPDAQTTHFYADLYASLRKRGQPIPTNDLWIAALALQHDLVLFARDRHFDAIPELARL